jgi:RND family efflux transporter MFP subunit
MSFFEPAVGLEAGVARLQLLREATRTFNSSLDLHTIFESVLGKVTELLNAEAASIWLVKNPTQELQCETATGLVRDSIEGMRIPWGTGVVGWVIEHSKPVRVDDAQRDVFLLQSVDSITGYVTHSMICAPMVARNRCLGAIQIINKVPFTDSFTDDDLAMLAELAIDAAIAVENARLYQTESRVKELQVLLKISREIASTLDLDRILKTAANILSLVVSYERCAIALVEGDRLALNAISGTEQLDPKDPKHKPLVTFVNHMAEVGDMTYLVCSEGGEDLWDELNREPVFDDVIQAYMVAADACSVIVLPLQDEEGLVGLMVLDARPSQSFTETDLEIISILASQVTVAIRNSLLYRQVPTFSMRSIQGLLAPRKQRTNRLVPGLAVAAALALVLGLVRLPQTVSGPAQVLPATQASVATSDGGIVHQVFVDEGAVVKAGQPIAQLDDRELRLRAQNVQTELALSRVRIQQLRLASDVGAVGIEEIKEQGLASEAALLSAKIAHALLRAPMTGVVITPKVAERVGLSLGPGEELLKLADTSRVTIEVTVNESDLDRVAVDEPVALRLLAFPARTFAGRVGLISPEALPAANGAKPAFKVTAQVENAGGLLRTGMRGTAKIVSGSRPLADLLWHDPWSWLQLTWWRLKP